MNTVKEIIATDSEFDLEAIKDLPEFDPAEHLTSEESLLAYVNDFLAEGDPAMIAAALGVAAKARGMSEISTQTGIARESLYKALRANSQPRLDTILKVLKALGIKLVAQPLTEEDVANLHS